jgi:hypothetical protein
MCNGRQRFVHKGVLHCSEGAGIEDWVLKTVEALHHPSFARHNAPGLVSGLTYCAPSAGNAVRGNYYQEALAVDDAAPLLEWCEQVCVVCHGVLASNVHWINSRI